MSQAEFNARLSFVNEMIAGLLDLQGSHENLEEFEYWMDAKDDLIGNGLKFGLVGLSEGDI